MSRLAELLVFDTEDRWKGRKQGRQLRTRMRGPQSNTIQQSHPYGDERELGLLRNGRSGVSTAGDGRRRAHRRFLPSVRAHQDEAVEPRHLSRRLPFHGRQPCPCLSLEAQDPPLDSRTVQSAQGFAHHSLGNGVHTLLVLHQGRGGGNNDPLIS